MMMMMFMGIFCSLRSPLKKLTLVWMLHCLAALLHSSSTSAPFRTRLALIRVELGALPMWWSETVDKMTCCS